ncbi:MAG: aldolase [Acidobacteriota bacterium]
MKLITMQSRQNLSPDAPRATECQRRLHEADGRAHEPARPQDALLCDMQLPLRRTFCPLGYTVEIATNDAAVLFAAHQAFGHRNASRDSGLPPISVGVHPGTCMRRPPEPIRRQFNHLYSLVADGDNQALLDLRTGTSFVWITEAAARDPLYLRYHFLEKVVYLLLGATVVTDIHAGCVSRNGKGILLCGDSGAGKSTLAYACGRAGWTYTSDDTSYLIHGSAVPRIIGHAHRARFRPSACELFPELRSFGLTPRLEGKPSIEVRTAELPLSQTAEEADVHAVVFLRRSCDAAPRLARLPAGTASRRLAAELFSAGEIRAKHTAILETLAAVPTLDLHYHDLNDAIRTLEGLTDPA